MVYCIVPDILGSDSMETVLKKEAYGGDDYEKINMD